ncbi:MAG: GLPGLI family protein, partial [Polaribacter sp.]|nr:GLPGLI family protein [Polaribacter sp.]
DKNYINQTEILGKRFLIKDSLPKYDWQLTADTKNIGQYTCYKAIYTREVDKTNVTLVDGDLKEVTTKEKITTTAWYTPQIPIDNGPSSYQGLPGLILEINDGTNTIVCVEVIISNEKKAIVEPDKGDVVTQEEYEKISREKSKEMMERFKSRDGKGIEIKIGG